MDTKYALLGFLNTSPNYGYQLKKLYDRFFGQQKPILSGQIYSTLSRLERDKKVSEIAEKDEFSGGPDRVKYEITTQGSHDFNIWLKTAEAPAPNLQALLYLKTVLALLNDDEASQYLDAQRHAHIERMRQLTRRRAGSSLAEKLLIDHALFHIEADLRWMELTNARLIKLKEEICQ